MRETLKKAIAIEADALARRHHIKSKQRVRAIMERTAVDCDGRSLAEFAGEGDPLENGLMFSPSLDEALMYLPPENALTEFECIDLPILLRRTQLIDYFADPATPFYTIEEFAQLMTEYGRHLEANRESLVRTGFPKTSFERCKWLDYRLGHLNFTKMPLSVHGNTAPGARRLAELEGKAERDVEGNLVYDYLWGEISPPDKDVWLGWDGPEVSRTDGPDETLIPISRCTYEKAGLLACLSPDVARMLEERRERFLRVKIDVLDALAECLKSPGSPGQVWDACLRILTDAFTQQDIGFYFRVDSFFAELGVPFYLTYLYSDFSYEGCWGGIRDLIHVIGHCEKESTIGTLCKTKAPFSDHSLGVESIESYFQVIDKPFQSGVDRALDAFQDLEKEEECFWADFWKRVNKALGTEFNVDVTITTRVKSKHVNRFKPFIESFAQWQARSLRETDKLASVDGVLQAGKLQSKATRKQETDYDKFQYKCYDGLHIPGTIPMSRSNIVVINQQEIELGDSLFVLLLRFVEALKKGEGGWVSRIDLWKEGVVSDPEAPQPYGNLRKPIEGYLLDKDGENFIENDGSKNYRVSTHPDFITYDKKKLLEHPDARIRKIAKRLPPSPKAESV
jgi:hypothetical protein